MVLTKEEVERRIANLEQQIPQANGEYRESLEQNLLVFRRMLTVADVLWRIGPRRDT